jgi:3-deoxy-D-manno-octulosonic acid kinase
MKPPSFVEVRPSPDSWLMVERDYVASARTLGLYRRESIAAWIDGECGTPHAAGRAPTRICTLPDRPEALLLRRVLHGGLLAPLWTGRIASLSRPRTELRVTATLRAKGAPVPRPVLALARRRGLLWDAALATVFEAGTLDGLAFLATRPTPAQACGAALAAGGAIRAFHDLGGRHGDLHAGNLLVRARSEPDPLGDACDEYDAWVIDLDRARVGPPAPLSVRSAELRRLARSLRKRGLLAQLDSSVREAFWSGYCKGDPGLRSALRDARRPWHRR